MNALVKILIVDDHVFVAEDLANRLKDYEVIGPFFSGEEALHTELPSLAILDIDLGGELSGLDLAENLNDKGVVPIIFITKVQDDSLVYKRIAQFDFPVFYISKPVSTNELMVNIKNALKTIELDYVAETSSEKTVEDFALIKNKILIRNGNGVYSLDVKRDLICAKSDGEATKLFTTQQELPVVVSFHLKEFLSRLSQVTDCMVRTSRFSAINIHMLVKISDSHLNLSKNKYLVVEGTNQELLLTPKYRENLLKRFRSI